jgi:hypothetical protein
VAVLAPAPGLSRRGPADDPRSSGEVLRQLWVPLAPPVDRNAPLRVPPSEPRRSVPGRQRASRRAGKGAVAAAEAEARAQPGATQRGDWENAHVGPSLLAYARGGQGRRRQIVDPTPVEGPLEPGPYECRGVGKHEAGRRARGDTWAP